MRTIDSSNDSHGPWIFRTLSIFQIGLETTEIRVKTQIDTVVGGITPAREGDRESDTCHLKCAIKRCAQPRERDRLFVGCTHTLRAQREREEEREREREREKER